MTDGGAVTDALESLLVEGGAGREVLAPGLVAAVGEQRLDEVLEATHGRIGPVHRVVESAEHGWVVEGERGRVPAWGRVGPDGRLTGLMISAGVIPTGGRVRRVLKAVPSRVTDVLYLAPFLPAVACWTAATVSGFLSSLALLALVWVSVLGWGVAAMLPRPASALLSAATATALAAVWRLPGLPFGHFGVGEAIVPLGLVAALLAVARARRHDWDAALSQPLRFPLSGTWYVAQGGGRMINHHAPFPDQRGAVDLVRLGAEGRRRTARDTALTSYAAYGSALTAPCDGVVVAAVDGLPDEVPGRPRYGPPEGNHLRIDTGHETVLLAHLKPGSLRVASGDTVRVGQHLADVGNSGNTTEPHLHLHAERDGRGLDLRFAELGDRRLWRGRRITV
ncbi:M23 family metallopeptidase [Streptomyces sp. NPDC051976]|uniref:M23 family metallopeptidase n=1 Tax=Streptomyces sp. NPDC051976 TaxID=3154947 RepID=UPI00343AF6E9